MVILQRKILDLQHDVDAYDRAALVLVCDGLVIGEFLVLSVSGSDVRLGMNLAKDIAVIRADAIRRPEGPSDGWLAQRKAACAAGNLALALPCDANPVLVPDDDETDETDDDADPDIEPDWESHTPSAYSPASMAPRSVPQRPWGVPTTATPPALYTYRVQEGGRR